MAVREVLCSRKPLVASSLKRVVERGAQRWLMQVQVQDRVEFCGARLMHAKEGLHTQNFKMITE